MQPTDLEKDSVDIGCSEWMPVSTTVKLRCKVVQWKWVQEGGNILQGCSRPEFDLTDFQSNYRNCRSLHSSPFSENISTLSF